MNEVEKIKLLWLDDQIDDLGSYVMALSDFGFEIDSARTYEEAIQLLKIKQFDIVLADIRMPPPNGIEFVKKAHTIQRKAMYGFFSSYLYLHDYREDIRKLRFSVQPIEKQAVQTDSEEFQTLLVNPLKRLAREGVTDTVKRQDNNLEKGVEVNPFDISLEEFMAMPLLKKDQMVDIAEKKVQNVIDRAFAEGKIWVLFCGVHKTYRASATKREEIMSDKQIMSYASKQGRPAFHFFKPKDVEDIGSWSGCGKTEELDYYPTITVHIGEKRLDIHFDTGSPITFFSYEELVELGAIMPTHNFGKSKRLGKMYRCIELNIDAILECQEKGQKKIVHLIGEGVRNWKDGPFRRLCSEDCSRYPQVNNEKPRLCPERKGLIGRNLLTTNEDIRLVLDGNKRKTLLE